MNNHFYRAQSRLKSSKALRSLAQKAVAPFFREAGPATQGFMRSLHTFAQI